MHDDFTNLFIRWKDDDLTEDEEKSLMKMLASGKHSAKLDELLTEDQAVNDWELPVPVEQFYKDYNAVMAQIGDPEEKQFGFSLGQILAVAAGVLLAIVTGVWTYHGFNREGESITISSANGMRSFKLPDSTAVTLNEGSTLTYVGDFNGNIREVLLIGEAYFDVTHIPNRPFVVRTRDVSTTVLGTAFNVKAYQAELKIVVTVMRGEVRVGHEDFIFGKIVPNEEIVVDAASLTFQKSKVVADRAIVWKEGKGLAMDNVTMLEAAQMISEYFGVKVTLRNGNLDACRISAFFSKRETLENVLAAVSMAKRGSYAWEKGQAVIDGACD